MITLSRRVRPAIRRVAMAALVVLLPLAAWTTWDYIEAMRLKRIVDALNAQGESRAAETYGGTYPVGPADAGRYYDAAAALVTDADFSALALNRIADGPADGRAIELRKMTEWLDVNRDAEALLDRANELRFDGYRRDQDYASRSNGLSRLATLARVRTFERDAAADADGTAQGIRRELLIARARRRAAPGLPSYVALNMAARAFRNLNGALGASEQSLEALQRECRELSPDSVIEDLARKQRAALIEWFWNAGRGWYGRPREYVNTMKWPILRPVLAHRVVAELKEFDAFLAQSRRPWPERIGPHVPAPSGPRWTTGYLLPSHAVAELRRSNYLLSKWIAVALAELRAAAAVVSAERFRRTHGRLPATLGEMVPAYMPEVPIDPFSGAPLRYVPDGSGFSVYSIGENRTDDGGSRELWRLDNEPPKPKDIGFNIER